MKNYTVFACFPKQRTARTLSTFHEFRPCMSPLTPPQFQSATNVSRETLARLRVYADLLIKWQKRINLVGPKTLSDLWRRHMLDSAQLFPLIPAAAQTLVDLGSGAGFPGLVLAIMGVPDVHLVESDSRKIAFLREAARITETPVTLHNQRLAMLPPFPADVITARALAPLETLLSYAQPFATTGSLCLFPKGKKANTELTAAEKSWTLRTRRIASLTDPDGVILCLTQMRQRAGK